MPPARRSSCPGAGTRCLPQATDLMKMLDFCGELNVTAEVEIIPIQKVNEVRAPAQVRREVPLLHRYGLPRIRVRAFAPSAVGERRQPGSNSCAHAGAKLDFRRGEVPPARFQKM